MRKYTRCLSNALTLLLLLNTTSYAWFSRGHMMVAGVAYQKLTPAKKNRVEALLALNPDRVNWLALIPPGTSAAEREMLLFMIAATWPDRIKQNPAYNDDGTHGGNRPPVDASGNPLPSATQNIGYSDMLRHKYWHFVDLPFTRDGSTLPAVPTPNAQTQLTAFRAVLASATASEELKSYDLSWFLHLVGDVHQPLHCTARFSAALPEGDDGGNGVKLTGSLSNLHSFWDGALGDDDSPVTAAAALASLPTTGIGNTNDLDISHWIKEGFKAAKKNAYKDPPIGPGAGPFTPTDAYKNAVLALASKRVALGGARLAKILNNELK